MLFKNRISIFYIFFVNNYDINIKIINLEDKFSKESKYSNEEENKNDKIKTKETENAETNEEEEDIKIGSIPPPYITPLKGNIQYTLVLDLDETLVHY